jgi:nucleoside-diphosphate-sugar epimerase
MKVLITGGAGYLGSTMAKIMLDKGYEVTVLDNFMYGQNSLLDCCSYDTFDVIRGDCRDESILKNAIKDKDVLIPLAALVGAPLCDQDKTAAVGVNRDAIRSLCRLSSKDQQILYPVTNSGYGIGEKDKACTEESPLRPISLYGDTKVQAEEAVLERGNSITFRLATVFGVSPRMRLDLLVNDFVYRAVNDRTLVIFEGHFKRNFIHVRDVIKAFLHGIGNFESMKEKPYNVGLEDANLSKIELCEVIKKHVHNFVYLEAPIGEDPDKRDYIVSNERILGTGYRPDWNLAMGIKELKKCYTIIRQKGFSNV